MFKKLFDKTTTHGRVIRTFLQALVGLSGFVLGLFAIPGVYEYLYNNPELSIVSIATVISLVTYLHNSLEDFLKRLG